MSDEGTTPPPPQPALPDLDASPAAPPQRSGCMTAFMIISGLVLLFPGLCFLAFGSGYSGGFGVIGLVLLGVAATLLIRAFMPPGEQRP